MYETRCLSLLAFLLVPHKYFDVDALYAPPCHWFLNPHESCALTIPVAVPIISLHFVRRMSRLSLPVARQLATTQAFHFLKYMRRRRFDFLVSMVR